VTSAGELLVLAGRGVTDEFSDRFGSDVLKTFDDPYEALAAMGGRNWSSVVIAASYVGLSGLCRAVRRLQQDAKVIVLCGPATESEVRGLVDGVTAEKTIDDYFIYPLTNDEWKTFATADLSDSTQE
jgi:DNA-binding response OmpR family regulator